MSATLKLTAVRSAFAAAAARTPVVPLRGRGHAPRASVSCGGQISRAAAEACPGHTDQICGSKCGAPRTVFPVALIEAAAAELGVPAARLIGRTY